MIEVEHLTKYYGDILAISDLNFRVAPGEVVGFLGPNGSGKTTTMRILTGYMPASRGRVRIGGVDIQENPRAAQKMIGYLPEHPPLYNDMSVQSYLDFTARLKGVPEKEVPAARERVIAQCGLEEMRQRLIGKLSKGYRQRTGLAQAMIHQPSVLILDEPTIGLDPKQIAEVRSMIKNLAGTHTVILSTHILHEVTLTCQRAIIVHRGEIKGDDTVANLTREGDLEHTFLRLIEGRPAPAAPGAEAGGSG